MAVTTSPQPWRPRLSLGPIPYFWPRQAVLEFYARMAEAAVDVVYLGETVCAKRRELRLDDWLGIAAELEAAGKEVVLSTLALIEAESELSMVQRYCRNGRYPVEANDMGAVNLLRGSAFVLGPGINVYNARSLARMAGAGAWRWVLPPELGRATLAELQRQRPPGMETEVLAFGRLPLSYSARCFTARALDRPKDACGFACIEHPDGLLLESREGQPFLTINGVQTQSAPAFSLLGALGDLAGAGVDLLRIAPQQRGTPELIALFREALAGTRAPEDAQGAAAQWSAAGLCDGYWYGQPGIAVAAPHEREG